MLIYVYMEPSRTLKTQNPPENFLVTLAGLAILQSRVIIIIIVIYYVFSLIITVPYSYDYRIISFFTWLTQLMNELSWLN
jgi:hypothetical protein